MAYRELAETFTVTIKVAAVCALTLSGPWLLFQFWRFVAAGLYPHERRYVTRYLPLSISLLVAGTLFFYFLVLPWTIGFLLGFGESFPMPRELTSPARVEVPEPTFVSLLQGDPTSPQEGQIWVNQIEGRMKVFWGGRPRVMQVGSESLFTPQVTLSDYVDTVLMMLLTFALSFQLPLVVLALQRIGVVDLAALRSARRYVYFAVVVLAAVITPGDFVSTTLALAMPLALLYELGIWLASFGGAANRSRAASAAARSVPQ